MTAPTSAGRTRSRSRRDPQPSPVNVRVVMTVAATTLLAAAPIAFILRMPVDERPDPGLLLAILVGSGIGAAIYWSLPQRHTGRRRSQAGRRLLATAAWAFLGGMLVSLSGTLTANADMSSFGFGSAVSFALWCSMFAAIAAAMLRQPRRPIGRQRTRSEGSYDSYPTRPFAVSDVRNMRASSDALDRECPWCAERILRRAKVCKHCGRDVEPEI